MTVDQKKLSLYQLLEHAVNKSPDREVIYDLKRRLTYQELYDEVNTVGDALAELGVKKGDRVGVSLPNWHETVVLFFAIAKLGAVVVPFNPHYKVNEVKHIIGNSEPKLVFVSSSFESNVGIEKIAPLIEKVITVRFELPHSLSYSMLLTTEGKEETHETPIDVDEDLFCILYTSGTTGVPKGVMMTHRCVVQSGVTLSNGLRCTSQDVFIVPAPVFHIFGMVCNVFAAVANEAKLVLQEKYKPQDTLQLIEQEKVTIHQGVPTMFIKELNTANFSSYNLSTLRTGMVGAAPCPPNTIKDIKEKMGLNLLISFGITEAGTVTLTEYDEADQNVYETVGKAIDGVELKIVNDEREKLPPGEIGEIACRGFGVMRGYYKLPEQTTQVLDDDGWFYTGDLGTLDDNGYLRFVGRKKEMIIRGGYNIYPQELEEALAQHPKVMESAVIGLPDEVLGEIVCAVIKLKEGESATAEELKDYLKSTVAIYKVPAEIIFTDQFPATSSGKIQKSRLREFIMQDVKK